MSEDKTLQELIDEREKLKNKIEEMEEAYPKLEMKQVDYGEDVPPFFPKDKPPGWFEELESLKQQLKIVEQEISAIRGATKTG
jgi:SMC interacting uncharacterized protein involved in chromosome segregation